MRGKTVAEDVRKHLFPLYPGKECAVIDNFSYPSRSEGVPPGVQEEEGGLRKNGTAYLEVSKEGFFTRFVEGNEAFFSSLTPNANHHLREIYVFYLKRSNLAHAHPAGVEGLKERPVSQGLKIFRVFPSLPFEGFKNPKNLLRGQKLREFFFYSQSSNGVTGAERDEAPPAEEAIEASQGRGTVNLRNPFELTVNLEIHEEIPNILRGSKKEVFPFLFRPQKLYKLDDHPEIIFDSMRG